MEHILKNQKIGRRTREDGKASELLKYNKDIRV